MGRRLASRLPLHLSAHCPTTREQRGHEEPVILHYLYLLCVLRGYGNSNAHAENGNVFEILYVLNATCHEAVVTGGFSTWAFMPDTATVGL